MTIEHSSGWLFMIKWWIPILQGGETLNEEIPKEILDPTQKHNGQPATENAQPATTQTSQLSTKTTQQTAGSGEPRTVSRAGSVKSETLEDISKVVQHFFLQKEVDFLSKNVSTVVCIYLFLLVKHYMKKYFHNYFRTNFLHFSLQSTDKIITFYV